MKTYYLNEITSSRIQYDKNPPKFMFYIILAFLFLLIGLGFLASFTYKTEVVRTRGILSSMNKTYIQSSISGEIVNINHENGDYVNEGDILFELDSTETESSILALTAKTELLNSYIDNYEILISTLSSIDCNDISNVTNPFSGNEFYYMFKSFYNSLEATEASGDTTLVEARQNIIDQYLQQYYSSIFQYRYEEIGNASQIEAYENLLDRYVVYATTSGYLNYSSNIGVGSVIDQSAIGSISEELTLDNAVIECYVSASSRSFIDIGTEVEVVMAGLSQSVYGTVSGEILTIASDITTDDDNNVYYKISIKPEELILSGDGTTIDLINGQIGEVRIKYDSITWMHFILKKIGILDR